MMQIQQALMQSIHDRLSSPQTNEALALKADKHQRAQPSCRQIEQHTI